MRASPTSTGTARTSPRTIVGTGAASGGDYKGVAPGADLIVGKVLGGAEGYGQDSWVIAGMQWAAESGADVVSMSLGDSSPSDGSDPMSQAVDALSAQYGTLFVIAAGNSGPETISAPGAAASALTVGATDKQDELAYFSSTGPLACSGAMKPDIAAPGVDITAARSQEMTDGGEGLYRTISGTSMATPHVSGAAAILAQQHPDWTGAQLKEHLMSSAKGLADGYSPYEVGTGRLDVAAADRHHGPRHRLAVLRQLHLAARAERRRRHQGPDLHQHRRRRRHARPGADRRRRPVHAGRAHGDRPGRRQGHRPGHRRPAGRRTSAATSATWSAPTRPPGSR